MPRGRKPAPKTFEEHIALIDSQINNHKQAIEVLKTQRKNVIAAKEKADMQALMEAVKASGKSPSELLAELKGN